MKAILEFSLPEEQEEHQTALDAGKWKEMVHEIDNLLRASLKHGDGVIKAEEMRKTLYDDLMGWGLTL